MSQTRRLLFGYFAVPEAAAWERLLEQAREIDALGLDLIGIQDHPYQPRFLDTLALLSMIGAQTKRLRLVTDVVNLQLRPPAVLAKWAASVDLMTGGRVELGLGAGAFAQAVTAMGTDARQGGEAVAALEEAITVIRLMWGGQRNARFDGRFYRLRGVHPGPVPAHPIEIWIGAAKPRMLALTGRLADGWLPSLGYLTLDALDEASRRVDEAAQAAGRDPSAIVRLINIFGRITDGDSAGFLEGPVDQWVDQLTMLAVDHRFDGFLFGVSGDPESQLRRFAEEVVPRVRTMVGRQPAPR